MARWAVRIAAHQPPWGVNGRAHDVLLCQTGHGPMHVMTRPADPRLRAESVLGRSHPHLFRKAALAATAEELPFHAQRAGCRTR